MDILTYKQIEAVISWMNTWEQLRNTAIPMRFREDFTNKLQQAVENGAVCDLIGHEWFNYWDDINNYEKCKKCKIKRNY